MYFCTGTCMSIWPRSTNKASPQAVSGLETLPIRKRVAGQVSVTESLRPDNRAVHRHGHGQPRHFGCDVCLDNYACLRNCVGSRIRRGCLLDEIVRRGRTGSASGGLFRAGSGGQQPGR